MGRIAVVCVSLALLTAPVAAKGPTTRIVIKDLERGRVIEITDRSLLNQFHVWSGQGTYSGPPGQATEATEGFIIDWPAGIVDERPSQLRRYEVSFYAEKRATGSAPVTNAREELAYVVLYENDPSTGQGYVYLPGRGDDHYSLNVRSIHRRVEGHWLRASEAWQTAMTVLPS